MIRAERFWAKVDKRGPDACWPWLASRCDSGYGKFRVGKMTRSHRVAFELGGGEIPDGQCVLHRCDNPACCNPAHLFVGTFNDNVQDMVRKGRQRSGTDWTDGVCINGHPVTDENTYEHNCNRYCRECRRLAWRAWKSRQRIAA